MILNIEINRCKECPYLDFTMEGYICSKLPLNRSFVLEDGGHNKIVDRCPIKNIEKE